jgi:hypothetical protein
MVARALSHSRSIAQVDPDPRSTRLLGFECDTAAVRFDDLACDREAEASAVALGREERFE